MSYIEGNNVMWDYQKKTPPAGGIVESLISPQERAKLEAIATGVKYDQDKLRFDLIPPEVELALAEVLTFGAKKYAPDNWRLVEDKKERYLAAMRRHMNAWQMGETDDPDSGKPHLWHALACLSFLVVDQTFDSEN
jgi:hypothetical protein